MRRVLVAEVKLGDVGLAREQLHHLKDVLRLADGVAVEVFDSVGRVGQGLLRGDWVTVERVTETPAGLRWTVAGAVPKGDRAEWMVEKLSELGAGRFVPLRTARSVVHPEGTSKRQRWERIAQESAQQSKRTGVMAIGELVEVRTFVKSLEGRAWYLSTAAGAASAEVAVARARGAGELTLLIGPEGGWTEAEMAAFAEAGLTPVTLGPTILRIETAAVAAGAIVAAFLSRSEA